MPPPVHSQTTLDSGVNFMLLNLTNNVDAREKVDTPVLPLPNSTKPDYVVRRIQCWNKGYVSAELLDVSTSLPLGAQVTFRRKLLFVLALQLLAVWVAVGLATFYPPVRDRVIPVFVDRNPVLLGVCATLTIVLLGVLYCQRRRRYVNTLVLMWFSAAQAATFVGFGVMFDTHISFFNCGATFTWALLMILLVGVQLKGVSGYSYIPERHLMSPLKAGVLSFAVVICVSCVLFIIFGTRFVSRSAFGYSLIFQFLLVSWFTWDATCMFEVVAVDEFAQGVIYIYTDIVLSVLLSVAVASVALGFSSRMVLTIANGGGGPDSCCCCQFGFDWGTTRNCTARTQPGANPAARTEIHTLQDGRMNRV